MVFLFYYPGYAVVKSWFCKNLRHRGTENTKKITTLRLGVSVAISPIDLTTQKNFTLTGIRNINME